MISVFEADFGGGTKPATDMFFITNYG